ncbi:hypothetical protein GJ699_02290 [Duganella sp. FT80W]|uniref:Uncharacterized protein n=1 Tax=Duganella guangzhouensis TaxID=2666084 RepID=A0A6I2KTY7_9BURK|nr:hypothetical protein [Duganella guangzhouensis]MRW88810.1 hypothetical protein [Duganella guangzhouensis]
MMQEYKSQNPTAAERDQFAIRAMRGVDIGLGAADAGAVQAAKLEQQYRDHLILIQAGGFLHGFDRTAHVLATLKSYKLQLVGTTDQPHIRVGFPIKNFQKRLWPMVQEFGMPYVVALGARGEDQKIYVSEQNAGTSNLMASVSADIVHQVIDDLRTRGQLSQAAAKQILANPDSSGFKLKSHAQALDDALLADIIKMPRDLRTTYGENLRACMGRIMRAIYAFGEAANKPIVLTSISADIDLLKHYLTQAAGLSQLKFAFEHRVGLAVELGRLTGGIMRSMKAKA